MEFNKLVRDNIPDIIPIKHNKKAITHIADDDEYHQKLCDKLKEETAEYLSESDHKKCVEELTDILEVVYALARYHHITRNELEQLRKEKLHKNGAFKNRVILERVE